MSTPLFEREDPERSIELPNGDAEKLILASPSSLTLDEILHALSGPQSFLETVVGSQLPIPLRALEALLDLWVEQYGLVGGRDLTRLLFYVDRYPAEIEWDLQEHLALDAVALWQARRWRKLLAMIDQLPRASRYHQAMSMDEEHAEQLAAALVARGQDKDEKAEAPAAPLSTWTPELEMLTNIHDALQGLTWVTQSVNSKNEVPQPKPTPRPTTALGRILERQRYEARLARHKTLARRLVPHRFKDADEVD